MDINSTVISFSLDGVVEAMHREKMFPLSFLGPMEIDRASDIRFDTATQSWGIHLADGQGGFSDPVCPQASGFLTYEAAVHMEILWLEQSRLEGYQPGSPEGIVVLRALQAAAVAHALM